MVLMTWGLNSECSTWLTRGVRKILRNSEKVSDFVKSSYWGKTKRGRVVSISRSDQF